MQDTSLIYKDQILTNVMLKYPDQGFAAEKVLPTLNVPDLTGVAFKLDESHLRAPIGGSLRNGYARANRVDWGLSQVSYGPLFEHSLETGIPDSVMRLYKQPLSPETTATNVVSKQLMNEKEVLVKNLVTTLANYPSGNKITLSGSSQFDNAASDPVGVATVARRAVKLACGNYPNKVVMNPDVRDALRNNAAVKARIQYAAKLTLEELDSQIANLLNVNEIIIADAVLSDQAENSTTDGTKSYIWGDDMAFIYVAEEPAIEEISFGYILRLNPEHEVPNPTGNGSAFVGVDKWYEQDKKTTFVRANDFYTTWQVAAGAGYLVKDTLLAY
jgi:hypothetical protein